MDKIALREVTIEDAEYLQPIWTDNDVIKYTMINNMDSMENVKNRILRQLKWKELDGIGPYVIIKNTKIVGYCGGTRTSNSVKEYEIFYHLAKEEWGNGHGTRVAKMLVDIAFNNKNAEKVIAESYIGNIGSCRVLEKLGMKKKEIVKRKIRTNEEEYAMYVYELCK